MTAVIAAALASVGLPFTDVHVTESINNLPSYFGQLAADNMFAPEGMTSAIVEIVLVDNVITALPVTPDGQPTLNKQDGQHAIYFRVPNISHQHVIRPQDIRDMLEKAKRSRSPATLASEMNKHLEKLKRKFDITLELLRMGALRGLITDGAGKELYDLFEAFEVEKKVVHFDLATPGTKVLDKCQEVIALIEDDLSDETMTNVECRVSTQFFNNLINHAKVEKYWLNAQQALAIANPQQAQDGSYRPRVFTFGNIVFKEYSAKVPMFDGTSTRIIEAGVGHAYPSGTMDSHVTYAAPPLDVRVLDGSEAPAGGDDDLLHVTSELLRHGAGVELKGQMNALPLWRRPKLLVEVDDAAA